MKIGRVTRVIVVLMGICIIAAMGDDYYKTLGLNKGATDE